MYLRKMNWLVVTGHWSLGIGHQIVTCEYLRYQRETNWLVVIGEWLLVKIILLLLSKCNNFYGSCKEFLAKRCMTNIKKLAI